jgi:peptide/nickel transport system substrate-binding protein
MVIKELSKRFSFFLVLFVFLLSSCTDDTNNKNILFAIAQEPQNLDPRFQSDAASERLSELLFSPFFYFDKQFQPQSKLVNWQELNSLKYKFTIKKNLPKFHDLRTMDINDILVTLKTLRGLETSRFFTEFKNINNVKKTSDNSFIIELNHKDVNFLSRLNFFILPAELINKKHNFSVRPVGSGPFSFVSNVPHLKIKRISDGQIIEFIHIKDPTVRVLKLINNEIDLLQNDLPLEMIKLLEAEDKISTLKEFGSNVSYIGFNFNDSLLKNSFFRKALALAIDRQSLIDYFLNDRTRIANQILSPEHWASEKINTTEYNPNLAKDYIKEIGIIDPIVITLKTSTDPFRVKIATVIQKQLEIIGVKLVIKSLDWGTYFKDIQAGDFQLYGLTWVGIRNPEIYNKIFNSKLIPPKGLNRAGYNNKETDHLLIDAKKYNLWNKVIRKVHKDNVFMPLWFEGNFAAFNKNISGYYIHIDGSWKALNTVRKKNDDFN